MAYILQQGATLPAFQPTFTDDTGTAINLTGGTLALKLRNLSTLVETNGAGSWTVTNALQGKASYAWAAADTQTKGQFVILVSVTYAGGVMKFDPIALTIQ